MILYSIWPQLIIAKSCERSLQNIWTNSAFKCTFILTMFWTKRRTFFCCLLKISQVFLLMRFKFNVMKIRIMKHTSHFAPLQSLKKHTLKTRQRTQVDLFHTHNSVKVQLTKNESNSLWRNIPKENWQNDGPLPPWKVSRSSFADNDRSTT